MPFDGKFIEMYDPPLHAIFAVLLAAYHLLDITYPTAYVPVLRVLDKELLGKNTVTKPKEVSIVRFYRDLAEIELKLKK